MILAMAGRSPNNDAVLEVKGKAWLSREVGQPVTGRGSGDPAQVDVAVEPIEDHLDAQRLTSTPARRRDVDRPFLHRRGVGVGQRLAHVVAHRSSYASR
jgi:hypothetical protein